MIVHSLEISRHRDNTQRFIALAESLGQTAEAVPTLIACGVMETGWEDAASTGVALLQRLDQCRSQVQQGVTPGTLPTPEAVQKVRVPLLGEVTADQVSLPVFTLVLAGLDAFNPCAFLSSCFC
ncbi:MAG: hypothetical protein IPL59_12910 [Candidatus Competibacteraceae bacterium]|nr:hypothetical protein [Candidatus Competibacteraceae bacterium]